jgi:LmbE family N-acetylglucosaminyl deacetylase
MKPNALRVPPSGPLLVVSPHLDDAALSCSAILDRAEKADVITVFTGEPDPPFQGGWDRLTGFADSAASMAARREEDHIAFRGSGHRLRYLDLLDYEHSGHPRPRSDHDSIVNAVSEWADRVGEGVVALPAGAGRRLGPVRTRLRRRMGRFGGVLANPDHLLVRDSAIDSLAHRATFAVLLYEELPYALDMDADREVQSLAAKTSRRPAPESVEVDRDLKARRIGAYASQIPHLCADGLRLDAPESLPAFERYWYLLP